jgi:hypothetical protein
MRGCGVSMHVGSGARLPTLLSVIQHIADQGNTKILSVIIERSADPVISWRIRSGTKQSCPT